MLIVKLDLVLFDFRSEFKESSSPCRGVLKKKYTNSRNTNFNVKSQYKRHNKNVINLSVVD